MNILGMLPLRRSDFCLFGRFGLRHIYAAASFPCARLGVLHGDEVDDRIYHCFFSIFMCFRYAAMATLSLKRIEPHQGRHANLKCGDVLSIQSAEGYFTNRCGGGSWKLYIKILVIYNGFREQREMVLYYLILIYLSIISQL